MHLWCLNVLCVQVFMSERREADRRRAGIMSREWTLSEKARANLKDMQRQEQIDAVLRAERDKGLTR